ncbi:MAG: 4-(cytidine 5'-diphospho)-2-C-methyl-D-erythritol kinase [Gammaproteobacteria bacterium]|nr:4-(cytidine 5'-diphospho)-2-C-methyl-D-erythritol kinase [Gammaproteobacteria bacterium]
MRAGGRDWPAPAKINLFLHILGRRADGYHLLQTAFQFLDFGDVLRFEPRADARVRRLAGLDSIAEHEDLVVRAARRLQILAPHRGVDIHVRKRIPTGGGLGGGSSDAATTLVALNALWDLDLDPAALAAIGLELGADVPVFVHGVAAWGEGVGERLSPVAPAEGWMVVIRPGCGVPTAAVFGAPELTRDTPPITMHDFLAGRAGNDCEAVVRRRFPAVAAALDWLGRFAPARLTGTGACVFAPVASRERAREIVRQLPAGWQGYTTRARNRSPLLDRLARQ